MSQADIDVVRDQFEAVNAHDWERAMELYAEDVVLRVPHQEGVKGPGTYEGKEAVGEWFGDYFRSFADYRFAIDEIRELEGGLIFLSATHGGKGRLSGAEVHAVGGWLYRVRDGRVSEAGVFGTPEDALEAASLPEWSEAETH